MPGIMMRSNYEGNKSITSDRLGYNIAATWFKDLLSLP
jgi:hypothetical protein